MNSNFQKSIFLFGLNDVNANKVIEQLKTWPFNVLNSFDVSCNHNLKKEIIGVLIISVINIIPNEDLSLIYDLPNLKVISCNSSGIDFLNITELYNKNIIIKNIPEETGDSTSDIGIILILNLTRKVIKAIQVSHDPTIYTNALTEYKGTSIRGKTVGIVGLGNVGQQLAYKASLAFGMKVVYNQRNKRSDCAFPYYESLLEMLPIVDFLVLCCPLTVHTKHMIDLKKLRLMKPTSFLINIGRGSIIKTNDLVEALRCRFIAGAGLDVTDPEPLPRAHPLLQMDNVIVLPHIGTFTTEAENSMLDKALKNLKSTIYSD